MAKHLTNASKSFHIPRVKAGFCGLMLLMKKLSAIVCQEKAMSAAGAMCPVTRPAGIPCCRASCWNFGVAAEFVCPLRYFCGSLGLCHYVNAPCRLFVVFNVTKCITGAVNDDISFSGDTEREVVVLSFLLASPAETRKHNNQCE